MAKDIGIDLGTANVLIWIKGQGIVLNEPSIVAMEKETKKIIAVGKEANKMFGRTPGKVKAIKPMKDGVIADFEVTQIMLNTFIKKIKARSLFIRPRILICCPTNITPVEKNAIKEAAERTGARAVYIEEEPKVAAIGAGMDITKPEANMVIDIGGGTTDIAVLSLNDMVTSESIRIAGNVLDQDIIKYIKSKYKLLIGEKTAENLKINHANVFKPDKKIKVEVKGRNLITGLPHSEEINQVELEEAMHESLFRIIKAATNVLEQTPPELSADIANRGIVLTGGGAMLEGLTELFQKELNVQILIADSPLTCVVEGTGVLLEDIKRLEEDQN
ncbi:MAG: rod shape-determining protein [Bacilli bacterium]|nr:rod shape-determining protein [Bacilli bacterium]MBQ3468967.1 rod shape-determining protein [Bacilli bacterium]